MNRSLLLAVVFFTSGLLFAAQAQPAASNFLNSGSAEPVPGSAGAQAANAHEDELYNSATDALNDGQYDKAVMGFDEVAGLRGRKADGALYWKAYALHKLVRNPESLSVLDALRKGYPQSRWLRDAEALQIEVRGPSPQQEDPNAEGDDEMKVIALESVMRADPDRGVAAAQKLLQGNASLRVKERALFVLAQNRSEKAQGVLLSIAKGSAQPQLQIYAIRQLAIAGGKANDQTLRDIYAASTNPEVKKQVLRTFILNRDEQAVMNIIQKETSAELRREAIRQLGPMGASADLRQLYKQQTDAESKEAALQAMGVAGDAQGLIEIAKTETDPELRARAIRNVGIFGGAAAVPALTAIYDSNADVETRKQIIRALFIHGDAKDMVAIARKETNPELKKELVRNLSLMHSPEATDYMMEILNK